MKVAVVGATGLVGTRMLEVLAERNFPVTELLPVASAKSVGRKITFQGKEWTVVSAEDAIAARPDLALFSAGGGTSAELAPKFAAVGTRVVDNSSQWRMDPTKKLVVPEINGDVLEESDYIIANPNCSTIQMLLPLWPLHKAYTIKRIVVSTYQSVTGTGYKAMDQMGRIPCCISSSDRPEHPPAHLLIPLDRIYERGDEDGQRDSQDLRRRQHRSVTDHSARPCPGWPL